MGERHYYVRRNAEILDRFIGRGKWRGKPQGPIRIWEEMNQNEDIDMRPMSVKVVYHVVQGARRTGKLKAIIQHEDGP